MNSVKDHPWHAFPVEEIFRRIQSSKQGITEDEAAKRKKKYGLNEFIFQKRDTVLSIFFLGK